jgi:hypothetical protein
VRLGSIQIIYANGGGDTVTTATHTPKNAEITAVILSRCSSRSSSRAAATNQTFTLKTLASQLANAANRFSLFAGALFRGLLVVVAHLHFPENAFALHFLLESAERLINVVIADKYLHVNPIPLG